MRSAAPAASRPRRPRLRRPARAGWSRRLATAACWAALIVPAAVLAQPAPDAPPPRLQTMVDTDGDGVLDTPLAPGATLPTPPTPAGTIGPAAGGDDATPGAATDATTDATDDATPGAATDATTDATGDGAGHPGAVDPGFVRPEPPSVARVSGLKVDPIDHDDGRHLSIHADVDLPDGVPAAQVQLVVLRRPHADGLPARYPTVATVAGDGLHWSPDLLGGAEPPAPDAELKTGLQIGAWTAIAVVEADAGVPTDEVKPGRSYDYLAATVVRDADGTPLAVSPGVTVGPRSPRAAWFHLPRVAYLLLVLLIAGLVSLYIRKAKSSPEEVYVRRIPGVDAIEDAVGRSTEMGRPVLYVTGIEEITDIQTLASLLILGHVSELTANYDTEIKVANFYPLTMVVAEEIVRQGYANAGRLDAHRPENVMFITAEQFAFAAGVNGMILRDRPATNIYFGKFFAESLLLAETGFLTGAVQIAGTAEFTQLPFFIAACDYTLIGEELYATSAYLSRDPMLLANIKAGDAFKLMAIAFILVGALLATAEVHSIGSWQFDSLGEWVFR